MASLLALLIGGSLAAQQPTAANQSAQRTERQQQDAKVSSMDQTFAKCLAIANQEQVTLSRFAKVKSHNEEVQQFAATLEKAHQDCLEQLNGIAPQSDSQARAVTMDTTIAGKNSAGVDFLQLQQEISSQCLKDSQEYLSSKPGAEFDACFVGMQIAKHAGLRSAMTVLQRHATGELQSLIINGLEKNAQHMAVAVKLKGRLAANEPTKLSRATK